MALAPNTGMSKPEMKKLLNHSKEAPVSFAVGQGDSTALTLLILNRTKQPRATEADLKKDFPDAKNTRFGTAFVDMADDPNLVKFKVNRPVSGLAKRLIKTLKKTGFSKVVILTEDGSVMEAFEELDEEAALEDGAAAPAAVAAAPAGAPPAPPPLPEAKAAPTAEEKAAQVAALSKRLAELVPRIAGAAGDDAGRKEELGKLARLANTEIKTGNLAYAANSLAQLAAALAGPAVPPPPPAPPGAPAPPEQKAADAGVLAKKLATLAALIPGAAGNDAARKATLAKLATDANVNLKTGNLVYATNFLAQLEKALSAAGAAANGAAPDGAAPDLAKSRTTWVGARQQVVADVDKLRAALAVAYDGQPFAAEVLTRFGAVVAPVLERFNTKVEDAITGVMDADAAGRPAKLAEARAAVKDTLSFATSDKLIGELDANPFAPLGIRAAATAGLAAVAKAMT